MGRQRTRWLARWRYTKGHFVRAGIVNNLKPARDPEDVIRLQTHWLDGGDIDWTMRPDEALALVSVLNHAISCRITEVTWEEQRQVRRLRIAKQKGESRG